MTDRRRIVWSANMDATAQAMRGAGAPMDEIAERIGVSPLAVAMRFLRLGISRRHLSRGRMSGRAVIAADA